jgi:hypothetical protein
MSEKIKKQEIILNLRFAGLTYQQIGANLHISRQRVHQLIAPPKRVRDKIVRLAGGQCHNCGIQVNGSGHVHHISCQGENYNDIGNLQLLCLSCHRKAHSRPETICPICGKPKSNRNLLYCSRQCWQKAHQLELICTTCGKVFYRNITDAQQRYNFNNYYSKHGYERSDRYFCSKQCYGKWFAKNYGWGTRGKATLAKAVEDN